MTFDNDELKIILFGLYSIESLESLIENPIDCDYKCVDCNKCVLEYDALREKIKNLEIKIEASL